MRRKSQLFISLSLLLANASAFAALDGTADSNSFASQQNGDQIWDGASLQNDWVLNGGHTTAALSLSGSNLVFNADANNGWVEHDNGSTPWETATGKWTLEVSAKLVDNDPAINDGFVLWGERDGNRGVLWIQANSVTDLDGAEIAGGLDNTDGFHTFRVAFDPTDDTAAPGGTHHVWRDNVLISGAGVDINLAGGTNNRLIVGDCCTGIGNPVDQFEIEYIRYQPNMALAPVPEPSSIALSLLGIFGLFAARRHR